MKKLWLWTPIVIGIFLFSMGCGGGGSSPLPSGGSSVGVYVTDSPLSTYSQVLVTVLKAELANTDTGASLVLVDATATGGLTYDVTDLAGVLTLVNVAQIPPGEYNQVTITLSNSITLVDSSGNVTTAKFVPTGDTFTLQVQIQGNITVQPNATGTLILDFDLVQFNYDPSTGLVAATVIVDDSEQGYPGYGRLDKLEGKVTSIDASNLRLTILPEHSAIPVSIQVTPLTVCPGKGTGSACFNSLNIGDEVEAKGTLDLSALILTAVVMHSNPNPSPTPELQDAVEGVVANVDAGNSSFTLQLSEAKGFVPVLNSDGTLTVKVSENIIWEGFTELSDLQAGMVVEAKGQWDDTAHILSALKVEAKVAGENEGEPPKPPAGCTTTPTRTLADYGAIPFPEFKVEGVTLVSVNVGSDITVSASNGNTYYLVQNTKLEVEPSLHVCVENLSSYIGQEIEIKYVMGGTNRVALKLEVKTSSGSG